MLPQILEVHAVHNVGQVFMTSAKFFHFAVVST
jgi:hypothetical protein